MDSAIVTALAGVLGSLVGGTATAVTTWVSARTHSKRQLVAGEMKKREAVYGEFIKECCERAIDSFARSLDKPEMLLKTYELLNRIRLCASEEVLHEAERAVTVIMEQYFASNLSSEEMRALLRKGANADPLRPFAEACRAELKTMWASA
jgi:hypothetical protein